MKEDSQMSNLIDDDGEPDPHYSYPKTVEEYWNICHAYKDQLQGMVAEFHPGYRKKYSMQITAGAVEAVCEGVRKEIAERTTMDPVAEFIHLLDIKSPEMPSFLNRVWFGMPESYEVRSYPAFGVLCDLCSEGHCVYGDEAPEE